MCLFCVRGCSVGSVFWVMKAFLIWLSLVCFSKLYADSVTWRTFTGWDHGYTITIDGEASTISLVEHVSREKDKEPVVRKMPRSKTFVAYVSNLIEMIPAEKVGPQADDGRVIFVAARKGKNTIKKEILYIDLYVDPSLLSSTEDTPEKVNEAQVRKITKDTVAEFKVFAEAYMLQQMMFDLKERYFVDRISRDEKQGKK